MSTDKQIQLPFAKIISNQPTTPAAIKMLTQSYQINFSFFKQKPKFFNIYVCHTEKEYQKKSQYYYVPESVAVVLRNGDMIIRSLEFCQKQKKNTNKTYAATLTHEMNHVFWYSNYRTWKPIWLSEGLACAIAKQYRKWNQKYLKQIINNVTENLLEYRYLPKRIMKDIHTRYAVWEGFTEYLIRSNGKQKFLQMLQKMSRAKTIRNYEQTFKETYQKSPKKKFQEYVTEVKSKN